MSFVILRFVCFLTWFDFYDLFHYQSVICQCLWLHKNIHFTQMKQASLRGWEALGPRQRKVTIIQQVLYDLYTITATSLSQLWGASGAFIQHE